MMGKTITGVILAGGKSSRMGQAKAFLPYKGATLIEHIISEVKPYCKSIILSANDPEKYQYLSLPVITDQNRDCGPLGGLEAVLAKISTQYCFIVPCDLPFFSGKIIPVLSAEIEDADVCVPVINNFYEPLVALYSKNALSGIRHSIEQGSYKVMDAFKGLNVKKLEEDKIYQSNLQNIFLNINTWDEYQKLIRGKENG